MDVASSTIDQNHRALIPAEVIDALGLSPGEELHFYVIGGCLRVVHRKPAASFYGSLEGLEISSLDPEIRDRSDEI